MILRGNFKKPSFLPATALFVFSAGISFCGIIWLLTIYFMVTAEFDFLNYAICKRLAAFSYLELTTFIFIGFSILGLLLLPSRGKIYSVALIASCLSIAFNTGIMREVARIGHADAIQTFERIIKTSEAHPINMPRVKQRYGMAVDLWRELENPYFEPLEIAYWAEDAKAQFDKKNYTVWEIAHESSGQKIPVKLFCSAEQKAAAVLADGTWLYGFAHLQATSTNDFTNNGFPELIPVFLKSEDLTIEMYATKSDGKLEASYSIMSDTSWNDGFVEYIAAVPNRPVASDP